MSSFTENLKTWWDQISPWESKDAPAPVLPVLSERSDDERKTLLTRYVAAEVAKGGRVQLHTDFDAVLEFGQRPNHILHLLLCIPTFGLWIFVWILMAMVMKISTRKYHVDRFGRIEIV